MVFQSAHICYIWKCGMNGSSWYVLCVSYWKIFKAITVLNYVCWNNFSESTVLFTVYSVCNILNKSSRALPCWPMWLYINFPDHIHRLPTTISRYLVYAELASSNCAQGLYIKPMLKSMLVNKFLSIWLLIGWWLCWQLIRSHIWQVLLPNMDSNIKSS